MVAARFKEVGFAITNSFSDIVVRPYRGLVVVVVVGVVVALFLRIMSTNCPCPFTRWMEGKFSLVSANATWFSEVSYDAGSANKAPVRSTAKKIGRAHV